MRRIAMFMVTTVIMLVLLFSYHTSRGPGDLASPPAAIGDNKVGIVEGPASGPESTTGAAGPAPANDAPSDRTVVNGPVSSTRWGPVQVQVVIEGGRMTDVVTLQYPQSNGRDQQINAYALPRLRSRVLAAQSADVDVVTGATITSVGYLGSLQAALDMVHFG